MISPWDVYDENARNPTVLYRYFTPDGCLLYIGISNQPDERHFSHWKSAPWYIYATHKSTEWFPLRSLALWAEYETIRAEEPEFNRKAKYESAPNTPYAKAFIAKHGGLPKGDAHQWHTRDTTDRLGLRFVPIPEIKWFGSFEEWQESTKHVA